MAFVTKTWKDRLVEYAGRRKLKNVATGEEILVDVSRSEGTVNQAGDTFSATNMNNLEQRIKTEFDNVNNSLGGLSFGTDGDGNYGYYGADGSLIPFKIGFTTIINIPYCYYNTNTNMLALNVSNNKEIRISKVTTVNGASIKIYKTTSLVANSGNLPSGAIQLGIIGNGGSEITINLTNVDYLLLYSSGGPSYTSAHIELD